ncbi:MAG: ATP-binding cassette domain-containing protein [Janthinobacterium lividum]
MGASGCGKSTLLRALAGVLEHDAAPGQDPDQASGVTGEVLVDGRPTRPGAVGLLLQDPVDAVVAATAGRDTAFGPENLALPREEVWRRVGQAHAAAQFHAGRDREVVTLSGGERQRLALAGVLALHPPALLLDEPTSMLDAPTARYVRAALLTAANDRTLLVVDHDLAGWADHVDRVLVLGRDGRLIDDGTPAEVFRLRGQALSRNGLWLPGAAAPQPLDVASELLEPTVTVAGEVLRGRQIGLVRRRRGLRPSAAAAVLTDVDVTLGAGRVHALVGVSGSGKSSLLRVLAGLERVTSGDLGASRELAAGLRGVPARWPSRELARRVGWVPQTPEHGFVRATVREEAAATPTALGFGGERADALLEALGLSHRGDVNPFQLSGGEQRRLALAGSLAAGPALLSADEPSVGQDRGTWAVVAGLLRSAARAGVAVVVSSHDELLVGTVADDVLRLHDGRVAEPLRKAS